MKHNIYHLNEKRPDAKKFIGIDQPFDYEEVVSITGPEYVRNLHRDGIAVLPSEELKRNFVGLLLKDLEKPNCTKVSGFKVADDYYHHIGHSWTQLLRDGWVRIGMDDFTTKVFGQADAINLPSVGDFLMQGDVGWVMNRNGYKASMQSPVSGIVFAVNDRIKDYPELTHIDSYGEGWLFLLNPVSLETNKKALCSGRECFQWMERKTRAF